MLDQGQPVNFLLPHKKGETENIKFIAIGWDFSQGNSSSGPQKKSIPHATGRRLLSLIFGSPRLWRFYMVHFFLSLRQVWNRSPQNPAEKIGMEQ